MSTFSEIQEDALDIIECNQPRNDKFGESDEMWHVEWEPPASLSKRDWIIPAPTSDPHDQMLSGISMLSNNKETRHFNPYDDTPEAKNLSDRVEKALAWNFRQAARRRRTSIIRDMISSAIRYDAIFYEVVFLPYQAELFGFSRAREKAIKRYGNVAYVLHHPKNIYPRFSDYMMESVLSVQTMSLQKAIDFFGDKIKNTDDMSAEITVYDYWDLEKRAVWFSDSGNVSDGNIIIDPEEKDGEHGLPFIPWVCRVGGSTLEEDEENQYTPLCYATINSKAWKLQNVVRTIVLSEAIARMSSPRWGAFGPGASSVRVEYGDPAAHLVAEEEGTRVEAYNAVPIDQNLMNMVSMFRVDMDKAGLSALMQGGSMPSGTAYATYNIKMQSDMARLYPARELAQEAITDGDILDMQWHKHRGLDLVGYGMSKDDKYTKYVVKPKEYDIDKIHLEVELNPDIPIDRNQRINGAINLHERLGVPLEEVYSELGYEQPSDMMKQALFEMFTNVKRDAIIKRLMADVDLEIQAKAQQIQQRAAMQQMAMQQAAQGPTPQQRPQPGAAPGFPEQLKGFNNNPAEGAPAPQEAFPAGTMETQTGMSRGGEEGFER
jgi:hypothetical protein